MHTCTKLYSDIPFAHRQHNHDGHCALIHGHNWGFEFTFTCNELDGNGFVIDFGKLKWLKSWIDQNFDHALVLNIDDPYLGDLRDSLACPSAEVVFASITEVPNCGAEGLAQYLFQCVNRMLSTEVSQKITGPTRGVRVLEVTVYEDSKNKATYRSE